MADPKYAGLPGIATGQPDTFETSSDRELDNEEDSDSEQSETLHLSSLSWIGGELEIVGSEEKETLMQKFTRLRCEVNEFSDDLNSLTESAREGNLAGLHQQVTQLQEQLDVCIVEQDGAPSTQVTNQKHLLDNLKKYIEEIQSLSGNQTGDKSASYDLYLQVKEPVTSETLASLDKRLAQLERVIGPDPLSSRSVLSAGTDSLPLVDAVQTLEKRKFTLNKEHLSHVEGRLSALVSKMNALKDQKDQVASARNATEVGRLFDALETRAGIVTILPDIYERLQDLKELHKNSTEWNSRSSEISTDQEKTETLLSENRTQILSTQKLLTEGLQGVTQKLEKLQASLQTLPA